MKNIAGFKEMISRHLPESSGFYWWRKHQSEAWRMVQIINTTAGLPGLLPKMLNSYDVELMQWSGRSLNNWESNGFPIGEWIKCEKPGPLGIPANEKSSYPKD